MKTQLIKNSHDTGKWMTSFWKLLLLAQIILLKKRSFANKTDIVKKQNKKKNQTNISQKEQNFSKQQDTGKDTNIVTTSLKTTGYFMFTAINILRADELLHYSRRFSG